MAGGKTVSELSASLLRALDPDAIAEKAVGKSGASPDEVLPAAMTAARKSLADEACAPFDLPALRDALAKAKQDAEQTIDTTTIDTVQFSGFDAAAKARAQTLIQTFRDYVEQHHAEINALQILYSRPYQQRLTEPMLKELEKKLSETNATWTEDTLWRAYAATAPEKVKGRSQAGRFADLVALVRFSLEQQPVLEPFADSVKTRFDVWLSQRKGIAFTPNSSPGSSSSASTSPRPAASKQTISNSPLSPNAAASARLTNSSASNCPNCSTNSTRCLPHESKNCGAMARDFPREILPLKYGKARTDQFGYPRAQTSTFGSNGAFGEFHRALTEKPAIIVGRKEQQVLSITHLSRAGQ